MTMGINSHKTNKFNGFDVLYMNICSIKKKVDDLVNFMAYHKLSPDLIALTETWIGTHSVFKPKIDGYTYISADLDKRAGGVGIF